MGPQGDSLNVVKMESRDTSTSLKNWPCNLEKIHEDATRIVYVDDFNGSKIFIHVQRGGKIYIEVPAEIEKAISSTITLKPSVNRLFSTITVTRFADGVLVMITSFSGWKNREVYPFQATK